jgi:hypothetical protein
LKQGLPQPQALLALGPSARPLAVLQPNAETATPLPRNKPPPPQRTPHGKINLRNPRKMRSKRPQPRTTSLNAADVNVYFSDYCTRKLQRPISSMRENYRDPTPRVREISRAHPQAIAKSAPALLADYCLRIVTLESPALTLCAPRPSRRIATHASRLTTSLF